MRYKAELFDLSGRKIGELPYREDYGNIFYISPDGEKVVNTGCYDTQFTGIYLIFSKEGKLLDRFKIDEWQECINHAFSENSKFFVIVKPIWDPKREIPTSSELFFYNFDAKSLKKLNVKTWIGVKIEGSKVQLIGYGAKRGQGIEFTGKGPLEKTLNKVRKVFGK